MSSPAIEERDLELTLDTVESLFVIRRDADAEMFVLAAHFADLHPGQAVRSVREGNRALKGRERAVRLGGEGTPKVAEFCCLELGARMQMGSWSAKLYLADALDVRHRLPLMWRRVVGHDARVPFVRQVAARTRHLSVEAASYVDRAMADHVDGSMPWGRFVTRLEGKIVAADPDAAAERETARAAQQFAKRTRSSEDGTAGFYLRSTVGVIARVEATVAFVAEALASFGDDEPLDVRRVKALLVLCNPTVAVQLLAALTALRAKTVDVELPLDDREDDREDDTTATATGEEGGLPQALGPLDRMDAFARRVGFTPTHLPPWLAVRGQPSFAFDWSRLLPSLTLNLHLAHDDLTRGAGGVVRWDGEGPVTHQFLHDHLRPLHSYVIQPVIDLAGMAPVDSYEIPDRHRQAVRLRTPADCSPFSSRLADDSPGEMDVDHTEEYDAALATGPERYWSSRLPNYGPLGRFNHRLKTFGRWVVRQPFNGIQLWRDPHGQVYLVDHTGSRKITMPGSPAGAVVGFDPDVEVVAGGEVVEVDFGGQGGDRPGNPG